MKTADILDAHTPETDPHRRGLQVLAAVALTSRQDLTAAELAARVRLIDPAHADLVPGALDEVCAAMAGAR